MNNESEETKGEKVEKSGKSEGQKKPQTLKDALTEFDMLLMLYSKNRQGNFHFSITQEDERIVCKLLKGKKDKKKKLLIFLDSGGGDVYAAVKIMDLLRSEYDEITVAIAQEAKSSATMMCLGADKIIMSALSELGPLDKPMLHPNDETSAISALDIVKSLDGVIQTARNQQKKLADVLISKYGIRKEKAFEIAGDTIAKMMQPIFSKEDGKIYNQALRLLVIAELYGKEFLINYALAHLKNPNFIERAADLVINHLIWGYPDHRFAIRRDEAENKLLLQVEKSEELDYWNELWDEFERSINSKKKIIRFI